MAEAAKKAEFRIIPSVDELLKEDPLPALLEKHPHRLVVAAAREVLAELRLAVASNGELVRDRRGHLPAEVARRVEADVSPTLRPVINATGVILHTNLGRAPLPASALRAVAAAAGGYSNLEYDLATGQRGKRDVHTGRLLERLLGAPGIVVNNNAAALLLALNELATDGEVIISRGELIEIGDGFRIPDILSKSGARLREVGTTNRTRIEDYRAAITPQTRLILRVHPSNFRVVGFAGRPTLDELVALGKNAALPVMEDLGSGCLIDVREYGLEDEPRPQESLAAGVGVVAFSGDKLLGGPQAGILAGKADLITRIRRNPLFRALRVDKLTYAALAATLRAYLAEDKAGIPVLAMLAQTSDRIHARAATLLHRLDGIDGELVEGRSLVGGGSTPAFDLPTTLISLAPPRRFSAADCESRLREGGTPVIGRVEKNRVLLDLRTVFENQEDTLVDMLRRAWTA